MKFKKKLYTAGLVLTLCMATTSFVFAGEGETNTDAGGIFEITDTTTGEVFGLSMSPGVCINAETADNAFALATANGSANANNRIEYAIWSAFSGYYQQKNEDAAATFAAANMLYDGAAGDPSTTTSPFSGGDWTAIGEESGT